MGDLFNHYPKRLVREFKSYHYENPEIYKEFKKKALQARKAGFKRYSAKTIIGAIRWETDIYGKNDPYKINDKYASLYTRMLIEERPEFENFFELRIRPFYNYRGED